MQPVSFLRFRGVFRCVNVFVSDVKSRLVVNHVILVSVEYLGHVLHGVPGVPVVHEQRLHCSESTKRMNHT